MARPSVLNSALAYTIKINGLDLHDYGVLDYEVPHLGQAAANVQFASFPERHTAWGFSGTYQPRPFVISGMILGGSIAELRTNLDDLKGAAQAFRGKLHTIPNQIRVEFADETDRYYPCIYQGGFQVSPIGLSGTGARAAHFILPLMQLTPFAIATTTTTAAPSGTRPSFTTLSTGTAPSPFIVELQGAATAPDFVIANMSFYADFDWDLGATIITGVTHTASSGATTKSNQFEPGDYGGRYAQEATFATTWANIKSNPDAGTVILVVRPQFAFDVVGDKYLYQWYIDANNSVTLYYNATTDHFSFLKTIGGSSATIGSTPAETFATDTYMTLAFSWGAAGMKLYKDGATTDTGVVTTGITGSSGTVYLGQSASNAACKYDYAMIFPFQLSDTEVKRFCANPSEVRPFNTRKIKTNNLAANERSILDFENGTIEKLATDLTKTNDLGDWDTNGFPLLPPGQVCFHVPTGESIAGIKVSYRKRYL